MERAERAAAEVGDKARAVQVDGGDEEALASHLSGYDIVVNTMRSEAFLPPVRAAIRGGAHYCDVNPRRPEVLALDAEAKAAGVTAIVGNGIGPGVWDLMAMRAAAQLDETEQVQYGRTGVFARSRVLTARQWSHGAQESLAAIQGFRGFLEGMLRKAQDAASATALARKDGRWAEVDPLESGVDVPLPGGGTVTAHPYVSYEPPFERLPPGVSAVPPVALEFTPLPPQLHGLLREQAQRVRGGDTDAEAAVGVLYDAAARNPARWLTPPGDFAPLPPMWVSAVGHREGRPARQSCWIVPEAWNDRNWLRLTSGPLYTAALMVLGGEIRERGVTSAEIAFEPLPFFDRVSAVLPEPPPEGRLIGESFEWVA